VVSRFLLKNINHFIRVENKELRKIFGPKKDEVDPSDSVG
jgi:hypothetical protein